MKNVSAEVSLFCLWTNWIHLVICSKIVFRELYYCSRCALNKICEIYTFAVHWSGLAKHTFWLGATQKKRIREQLNYFGNMCPKPFSWAKNKIKLFFFFFSDGKSLARAARKIIHLPLVCSLKHQINITK